MLFHACGLFLIPLCLGFLIFLMAFKLVEKSLNLKDLLPIQMPDLFNNLFSDHFPVLSAETSRLYSRVRRLYHKIPGKVI